MGNINAVTVCKIQANYLSGIILMVMYSVLEQLIGFDDEQWTRW